MTVYKSKKATKDGRQYFFRIKYKDIFGVSHDYTSQKFKNMKDAKDAEARYRIDISNQEICTSVVTIDQIYQEYRNEKRKKLKPQSIIKDDNLYKYLSPIHNEKINALDINKLKNLKRYIESKNMSADYCNKILGLFRQIIFYSAKYYNTSDSVLKYIEKFKDVDKIKTEMLFFTYDEYQKFDKAISDFEHHTFFELLYFLGLRKGETQALTWRDIDFKKETININKTLTTQIKGIPWVVGPPKTKSSNRVLPLTKKLISDLKILKEESLKYKDFSEDWFVFGKTKPFPETTICTVKNQYCEDANVKQIRIHDFRHSCASLLINQGASIALVSKYLGHSNITITLNTYTHMFQSELENISSKLNNL